MNRRFVPNYFSNHSKITPEKHLKKITILLCEVGTEEGVILESFTKLKKDLKGRLDFRVYQVDYYSSLSSSS